MTTANVGKRCDSCGKLTKLLHVIDSGQSLCPACISELMPRRPIMKWAEHLIQRWRRLSVRTKFASSLAAIAIAALLLDPPIWQESWMRNAFKDDGTRVTAT